LMLRDPQHRGASAADRPATQPFFGAHPHDFATSKSAVK
jgi:hypothetical protein